MAQRFVDLNKMCNKIDKLGDKQLPDGVTTAHILRDCTVSSLDYDSDFDLSKFSDPLKHLNQKADPVGYSDAAAAAYSAAVAAYSKRYPEDAPYINVCAFNDAMRCITENNVAELRRLLELRPDLGVKVSSQSLTLLAVAMMHQNFDAVKTIVEICPKSKTVEFGYTYGMLPVDMITGKNMKKYLHFYKLVKLDDNVGTND